MKIRFSVRAVRALTGAVLSLIGHCWAGEMKFEMRAVTEADAPNSQQYSVTLRGHTETLSLEPEASISNSDIESAKSVYGQEGPKVLIVFTEAGKKRFAELTGKYKQIAILVNGKVISAPYIRGGPLLGGSAQISGDKMTQSEVDEIVAAFNSKESK